MKTRRYCLAMAAMIPVLALFPACTSEVGDEDDANVDIDAIAEASELEVEGNSDGTSCTGGCMPNSFVGAGSCTISCSPVYDCGSGMKKYSCTYTNYEHWKNCAGGNVYLKKQAWSSTTTCRSSPPVSGNCPGFCG